MVQVAAEVVLSAEKISKLYQMGTVDVHALREVDLELVRGWKLDEILVSESFADANHLEVGSTIGAVIGEEQRVNVIAEFCAGSPALGDGYRIDGELVVWEAIDALQVPVSALFRSGMNWNVFVVENDKAFLRKVEIGQRSQNNAEVLRGLNKGEAVILYPNDRLTQGALVTVILTK